MKVIVENIEWDFDLTNIPKPPSSLELEVSEEELGDKDLESYLQEVVEWSGMCPEDFDFRIIKEEDMDMKEYIVDLQSLRVDFPDDIAPDSPQGAKLVLTALRAKVKRGESIVENFFIDEDES